MNKYSKAFAKPRLTKRKRKAARGDNFMVQGCKETGDKIGDYIGAVPVYSDVNVAPPTAPERLVKMKTRAGIPFVRA